MDGNKGLLPLGLTVGVVFVLLPLVVTTPASVFIPGSGGLTALKGEAGIPTDFGPPGVEGVAGLKVILPGSPRIKGVQSDFESVH